MKWFLVSCAFCLVAASAAPDLMNLADPKVLANSIDQAVPDSPTPTSTEASVSTTQGPYTSISGTAADRTRLLETIFKGYNNKVIPDNVKLGFGMSLIDFSVCEKKNILGTYAWLKYQWEDSRLKWDPTEYGGITVLRVDPKDVWKPDVTLYNSADLVNMVNCWESNVLVYSSGMMLWIPPCKMSAQCHFNLAVHPYGPQTCSLKFGSWTYDGNVLDLQLYKALTSPTDALDLSDLNNSSGFEIVSTNAKRNERYYSCCAEPYPDVTFNITVKRVPGEELVKKL